LNFEEGADVHDGLYGGVQTVRFIRVEGHQSVQGVRTPQRAVPAVQDWRGIHIIGRQVTQYLPAERQGFPLAGADQMRRPADAKVYVRAAQRLKIDILARHGLNHLRSGQEHV